MTGKDKTESVVKSTANNCYVPIETDCPLCKERGKTWQGGNPVCAFTSGVFDSNNWNCATASKIRSLVIDDAIWNEDQYCAIKPVLDCGEFLLVSWYKRRGRTDGIWIVKDDKIEPITLDIAIEILDT